MAYIYQADVWCDKCGERIRFDLTQAGNAPEDPEDEHTYDSDEFPKYYDAENEESDSPANCASGNCAGFYGTFLENQLTAEGYKYLKEMLDAYTPASLSDAAKEWAEFYQFSYFEQPYSSPIDWLQQTLTDAAEAHCDGCTKLLDLAQAMLGAIDNDTVQDTFQNDMERDDFFKTTGWYSPEYEPSEA